jgi:hypothetical protein
MANVDSTVDFWSMRPSELRIECRSIAESTDPAIDAKLRTEAAHLAARWQEALEMPRSDAFEESRRASHIAAMRKRTMEFLVKIRGFE